MQIAFLSASSIFLVNRIRNGQVSTRERRHSKNRDADRSAIMKRLSILDWYCILRVQYQLKIFPSIRYAVWLARS
jgi:hypothetical protein